LLFQEIYNVIPLIKLVFFIFARTFEKIFMLIIPIKDGENIDRALKRFKRKFDKTGAMRELRSRKEFIKPSVKHRQKVQKAQHVQRLLDIQNQ